MTNAKTPAPPRTGYPPGMLQDDCRELSRWLASRPGARRQAREVAAAISGSPMPLKDIQR